MADVTVNPQQGDTSGVDITFTTLNAVDDFKLVNSGSLMLVLRETGAVAANVTVVTPFQIGGLQLDDALVAFVGSEEKWVGPFPRNVFGDTLTVTADGTNVDLAAVTIA